MDLQKGNFIRKAEDIAAILLNQVTTTHYNIITLP